jgi:hypothetical protein
MSAPPEKGPRTPIAAEIRSAAIERRAPRIDADALADWVIVLDRMLRTGELDGVEHTARHLRAAFPRLAFARNICDLFERMPAAEGLPAFEDDLDKDVQIIRRPGAEAAILLFCGFGNRAGLPLAVMHRWLGGLPAHLVYLRDFQRKFYVHGIQSLGRDRGATLSRLKRILRRLRARRILCFGTSGGVFGAMHYGALLQADRVLCFSGSTNLSPEFNAHSKRVELRRQLAVDAEAARNAKKGWRSILLPHLFDRAPVGLELDVRRYYEAVEHPPRTLLLFGADNWDDRIEAENVQNLPSVTVREVPQTGEHNILPDVVRRGEFESLLAWLMEPEPQREGFSRRGMRGHLVNLTTFVAGLRGSP